MFANWKMKMSVPFLLLLAFAVVVNGATLQLYETRDGRAYHRVLVPVSSTVIPLDDLPEYTVGAGVGVISGTPDGKVTKPEGEIKLITASKKGQSKEKLNKLYKSAVEEIFS